MFALYKKKKKKKKNNKKTTTTKNNNKNNNNNKKQQTFAFQFVLGSQTIWLDSHASPIAISGVRSCTVIRQNHWTMKKYVTVTYIFLVKGRTTIIITQYGSYPSNTI